MVKHNKIKNSSYSQLPEEIEHLESDSQYIPNNMNLHQNDIKMSDIFIYKVYIHLLFV